MNSVKLKREEIFSEFSVRNLPSLKEKDIETFLQYMEQTSVNKITFHSRGLRKQNLLRALFEFNAGSLKELEILIKTKHVHHSRVLSILQKTKKN